MLPKINKKPTQWTFFFKVSFTIFNRTTKEQKVLGNLSVCYLVESQIIREMPLSDLSLQVASGSLGLA